MISIYKTFQGLSIYKSFFTIYSLNSFFLSLLTITVPLGLHFFIFKENQFLSLSIGLLFAYFFVNTIYFLSFAKYYTKIIRDFHYCSSELMLILKKFQNYPKFMTPFTLISNIRERILIYCISFLSSTDQIGYYTIGQRLVNAPNSFISSTLRPIFFNYLTKDTFKTKYFVFHSYNIMILCSIPCICYYICSPIEVTKFFLGDQYGPASSYISILILPIYFLTLGNWMDKIFDVNGLQKLNFIIELSFSSCSIFIVSVLCIKNYPIITIVTVQSIFLSIFYFLWLLLVNKIINYPLKYAIFNFVLLLLILFSSILLFYKLITGLLLGLITSLVYTTFLLLFYKMFVNHVKKKNYTSFAVN